MPVVAFVALLATASSPGIVSSLTSDAGPAPLSDGPMSTGNPYEALARGEAVPLNPRAVDVQPQAIRPASVTTEYTVSIEDGFEGPSPLGDPIPAPTDAPFGTEVPVTTNAAAQGRPSIAGEPGGTTLYVAYTNQSGATQDVYVARSMNGGQTWTHVAVAAAPGYNEFQARVVVHGPRVFVFFANDDPGLNRGFRYAVSTNQGQTWSTQSLNYGASAPFRDLRNPDAYSYNGQWLYAVYETFCDVSAGCGGATTFAPVTLMFDLGGTVVPPSIYFPFGFDIIAPSIYAGPNWAMWIADADGTGVGGGAGDRDIIWMRSPTGQNTAASWVDAFITGLFSRDNVRVDAGGLSTNFAFTYMFVNPGQGINDRTILIMYNTNDGDPADWVLDVLAGAAGVDYKNPAIFASTPLFHVTFQMGGDLGYVYTLDLTTPWPAPVKVNSNSGTIVDAIRSNDVTYAGGVRVAWTDNRLGNNDIFYSRFSGFAFYIFDRSPRLGTLDINGIPTAVPTAMLWPSGSTQNVAAPTPDQTGPGTRYVFQQWSDANTNPSRALTVGATDLTLVAQYGTEYFLDISAAVGTTTPASGWFTSGAGVTIEWLPPAPGPSVRYTFQGWTGSGPGSYTGPANPTTINMNGPITEVASATEEFRFIFDTQPTGLNIVIDGGAPVAAPQTVWWVSGSTHSVQAVTPQQPAGPLQRYVFTRWLDGTTTPTRSITATAPANYTAVYDLEYQITFATNPAGRDVLIDTVRTTTPVTVWWKSGDVHLVDVPSPQMAGVDTRYVYSSWSDGLGQSHQITATGPMSLTVTFRTEYRYMFDTVPTSLELVVNGTAVPAPQTYWWTAGTTHTVEFTSPQAVGPDSRRMFLQWSDGATTNPRTFANIAAPGTFTVQTALEHRVRFDTVPSGVGIVINVNAIPITAPGEAWLLQGSTATIAATSPSPGATGVRYVWVSWSDGGLQSHTITVSAPMTLTATYRTQYFLTVTTPYGAKIGEAWYDAGTTAFAGVDTDIVSGAPGTRYVFVQWTGDASGTTFSQSNPITMDAPKTATAQWKTQYQLTATSQYGTVTQTNPNGWYDAGTTATVTVAPLMVPDAGNPQGIRYAFVQWTGGASGGGGTGTSAPITMDAAKTATAQWKTQYFLTVTTGTTETSVTVTCSVTDCWFDAGTTATLAMSTDGVETVPGQTRVGFIRWTGAASGTNWQASGSITMDGPKSASAEWRTQHKLTLVDDRGGVTQPAADGWYTEGSAATLTLALGTIPDTSNPLGIRHVFVQWTGAATGSQLTTSVTMDAPKTVTLQWKRQFLVVVGSQPALADVLAQTTINGQPSLLGQWVDEGAQVVIQVPAELTTQGKTYKFVSWAGMTGGTTLTITASTAPSNGPLAYVANYEEKGLLESPLVLGGLIAAIVAALLIAFLLLWRRKRKSEASPEETAGEPDLAPAHGAGAAGAAAAEGGTMACPSCGMTIPAAAGPCPICGEEVAPPPPQDERIQRLEQAYKSGRISKEQYQANLKRLRET